MFSHTLETCHYLADGLSWDKIFLYLQFGVGWFSAVAQSRVGPPSPSPQTLSVHSHIKAMDTPSLGLAHQLQGGGQIRLIKQQ